MHFSAVAFIIMHFESRQRDWINELLRGRGLRSGLKNRQGNAKEEPSLVQALLTHSPPTEGNEANLLGLGGARLSLNHRHTTMFFFQFRFSLKTGSDPSRP